MTVTTAGPATHRTHTTTDGWTPGRLVEGARAGDALAWRQLILRYDGLVRGTARRFRLSDADVCDVTQTTWLRLVECIGQITDPERIEGWLATTTSREALKVLRRQQKESPSEPGTFDDVVDRTAAGPEHRVLDLETQREVRAAVQELPPERQRLMWTLAGTQEPSYADVARQLGMPIGSIGPTRQRSLQQLRVGVVGRGFAVPV